MMANIWVLINNVGDFERFAQFADELRTTANQKSIIMTSPAATPLLIILNYFEQINSFSHPRVPGMITWRWRPYFYPLSIYTFPMWNQAFCSITGRKIKKLRGQSWKPSETTVPQCILRTGNPQPQPSSPAAETVQGNSIYTSIYM